MEVVSDLVVRREIAVGLVVLFVFSLLTAPYIGVMNWIGIAALVSFCLLVILWALNRLLRELLGRA